MGRTGIAPVSGISALADLNEESYCVDTFLRSAQISADSIRNLKTQVLSIGAGDYRMPVTVNSSEPNNTWICSPHTAYARYAIEELDRFGHPMLTKPLGRLCRAAGHYLWNSHIDDAVAVNNWLLSTNLYPPCDARALRSWINEASQRWPGHAIWFRSLNPRYTQDWIRELTNVGCVLIPSRQVYLYDRIALDGRHPQNLWRDMRLLKTSQMDVSPSSNWTSLDFERAAELYGQLYLVKYSSLNPDYSSAFLRIWSEAGLLDLNGFRDSGGVLQAVIGTYSRGDTVTAPIVGYNTAEPQRRGLYRLLMASVFRSAALTHRRINLSAGAAEFKRLRGGIGTIESSAVYVRHLPNSRQRSVSILSFLARRIGEPFMKRFEL
jgi:hypothetical protein